MYGQSVQILPLKQESLFLLNLIVDYTVVFMKTCVRNDHTVLMTKRRTFVASFGFGKPFRNRKPTSVQKVSCWFSRFRV